MAHPMEICHALWMTTRWIQLFLLVAAVPAQVYADPLHQCHGVWTDRPCAEVRPPEEGERGVVNMRREPATPAEVEAREARYLFNRLDIDRLRARRDYGIEFDVSNARMYCLGASLDYEKCRSEVTTLRERLTDRLLDARTAENQSGRSTATGGSSGAVSVPQDVNQVIVIDDRDDYRLRRRNDHDWHNRRHRHGVDHREPRFRGRDRDGGRGHDGDVIDYPRRPPVWRENPRSSGTWAHLGGNRRE